jgi:hypothetical protein
MRFPSHLPPRVSRAVALRAALGAVLGALVLVPAAGAAPGDRGVFVSKGVGRQIFAGGGGLTYGTLFSGGTLVVLDYSEAQDLKVESAVPPTTNPDGSLTYVPAGGTNRMIFRITGTLYTVRLFGSALYNGIGVYGRLQLRGGGPKATLVVNGKKLRWGPPANKLGRVPRPLRDLYELAVLGAPVPLPPAPPEPPPVTTTGTTPADTVRTDGS